MGSFKDFQREWSALREDCPESWTIHDLQLAAELGKTLLERNKELENCIKQQQCTIDDQAQEIEYMKKQTVALREVNDERLKIYGHLEVCVQDLDRANDRLVIENANDKKTIKSQCLAIDNLETRCVELQQKLDQVTRERDALQRQQTKNNSSDIPQNNVPNTRKASLLQDGSLQEVTYEQYEVIVKQAAASKSPTPSLDPETKVHQQVPEQEEENVAQLMQQLQDSRAHRIRLQEKMTDLKEQLNSMQHEHSAMEEQITYWREKANDIKNLQEEINTLEEVRDGHLCGRCLRGMATRPHDDLSVMLDHEEDDDISMAESFGINENKRDTETPTQDATNKPVGLPQDPSNNPYRDLVEKYEALLEMQRNPSIHKKSVGPALSLQEELEMSGEFNNFQNATEETQDTRSNRISNPKKPFSGTPTDFSEAETSSSGFLDETSNRGTQTEGRPGSFVCSIADEDCAFSIYDDSSTFESRFHKTPYRQLFSEIFDILKRAAAAKDEGEKLPLLDEPNTPKDETETPVPEEVPSEATDDTQSIASFAVSSVASEPVYPTHSPVFERKTKKTEFGAQKSDKPEPTLRPLHSNRRHQPLEYLMIQSRKKSASKKNQVRRGQETPTTPDVVPTTNPKLANSKSSSGRKKFRPLTHAEISDGIVWNGHTTHFFSSKNARRNLQNAYPRDSANSAGKSGQEYKPGTASEEVKRLRQLEMSYAEVLRMPNKPKGSNHVRRK